jgi:dipeptidase
VGSEASASGAAMVGHTEDSGASANDVRFVRVPRKQWPKGSMRPLYKVSANYPRIVDAERAPDYAAVGDQVPVPVLGYIEQVPETFAYWDLDYGVQNEHGLSIGESTCTANTVGWSSDVPYGYNKLGIEEMSKIAMERCATARCAVQLMGDLAVEHGFYSADSGNPAHPEYSGTSECLALADSAGELWNFHVLTGRNNASAIWAAQRMPKDHVVAVGNAFTIRALDLNDKDNFLYSADVTKLAEEMGWWSWDEAVAPGIFDFFSAYGYTPEPGNLADTLSYYSSRRMWRIFSLLSPHEGAKLDQDKGNLPKTKDPLPASVPAPKGSVTLQMVQDAFRDHYEGTKFDLTKGMAAGPFGNPNRIPGVGAVGGWERAISMYRTSWSFVNVARPQKLAQVWFAYDAPHGSTYLPFYGAATEGAPESYHSHKGHLAKFSFEVAWWPYNIINQYQDLNFKLINADVVARAHQVEAAARRQCAEWEANAAGSDHQLDVLTARTNALATEQVKETWEFVWHLFTKFGRYMITFNETETGEKSQFYPAWWMKSPEVSYVGWPFKDTSHAPSSQVPADHKVEYGLAGVVLGAILALGLTTMYSLAMRRRSLQRMPRPHLDLQLCEGQSV